MQQQHFSLKYKNNHFYSLFKGCGTDKSKFRFPTPVKVAFASGVLAFDLAGGVNAENQHLESLQRRHISGKLAFQIEQFALVRHAIAQIVPENLNQSRVSNVGRKQSSKESRVTWWPVL